jgi:CRISPR-associated protein Csd2
MKKYDFVMLIKAENCNPNGDPLNEGRPRTNITGHGEISAECIKRKIRNRLQDMGQDIFIQSEYRSDDEYSCLYDRSIANESLKNAFKDGDKKTAEAIACESWIDVRLFGQLFAFSASGGNSVSVAVRGPVSICHGITTAPVSVKDIQITKSCNSEPAKKGKKSSDTMGCKYIVERGIYVVKGSVNPHLSEKNGATEKDVELLKAALNTLFENDESSARPSGSMDVMKLYWFEQDGVNYTPSVRVHNLVKIDEDGNCSVDNIPSGIKMTVTPD